VKPTQEQVIAWAREAGYMHGGRSFDVYQYLPLVNLAYEAGRKGENEACAKVCEDDCGNGALNLADAIRPRREQ
jgi:hypothetical protein